MPASASLPAPESLDEKAARAVLPQLVTLLQDSVNAGASVGFLRPLTPDEATRYWEDVLREIGQGARLLLVVREAGQVLGAVQLSLCQRANGRHRAEVQKLLVHTLARRRGLARLLMNAVEAAARADGRTLLYLDTEPGQPAEEMYRKLGWTTAGAIPSYATNPDGHLHGTVIFFKTLAP